jgi:hypothetical protein
MRYVARSGSMRGLGGPSGRTHSGPIVADRTHSAAPHGYSAAAEPTGAEPMGLLDLVSLGYPGGLLPRLGCAARCHRCK